MKRALLRFALIATLLFGATTAFGASEASFDGGGGGYCIPFVNCINN